MAGSTYCATGSNTVSPVGNWNCCTMEYPGYPALAGAAALASPPAPTAACWAANSGPLAADTAGNPAEKCGNCSPPAPTLVAGIAGAPDTGTPGGAAGAGTAAGTAAGAGADVPPPSNAASTSGGRAPGSARRCTNALAAVANCTDNNTNNPKGAETPTLQHDSDTDATDAAVHTTRQHTCTPSNVPALRALTSCSASASPLDVSFLNAANVFALALISAICHQHSATGHIHTHTRVTHTRTRRKEGKQERRKEGRGSGSHHTFVRPRRVRDVQGQAAAAQGSGAERVGESAESEAAHTAAVGGEGAAAVGMRGPGHAVA